MTSHRTTTKILLTALLITLITGTTAAQSIEITNPADGAASNNDFDLQTEVQGISDTTISYSYFDGNTNNSIGSSSNGGDNYQFTWDVSTDSLSNGSYTVWATSSEGYSDSVEVVYDTGEPYVKGNSVSVVPKEDGTVDFSFEAGADVSELSEILLKRSNGTSDFQTIYNAESVGGSTATRTLVDENSDRKFGSFDYMIVVADEAGNTLEVTYNNMTGVQIADGIAPTIVDRSPGQDAYISSDSPKINVQIEDLLSGLKNATLSLEDNSTIFNESNYTSVRESASLDLDAGGLDDGVHTVQVTAYDQQDNNETNSWAFTVDTTKPDPSASLSPSPDGQKYLTTTIPLQVGVAEENVGPTKVDRITCYVDDPSDYNNDFGSASEYSDGSFRCGELNPGNYGEGSHNIYVEFFDRAGNVEKRNLGEYVFDTSAPVIEELTVTPEYTNEEPNVSIVASDLGSGVEDAEYMFSSNVDKGDGNTVSAGFEDGELSFKPNLRNKEDGEYELFVRVQDGSGKWSDVDSVNFTLDRGALPQPALQAEGTLNITSGDSTVFDVSVSNDGKVPLTNAQLRFIGDVEGTKEGIDVQGESSKTISITASTNKSFGQTEVTLKLTNSAVSENITVPVNIRASEEQQQQVNERITQYQTRLDLLKQNLTRLKEDGADQNLIEKMRTDIQEFESRLETVNASVSEGRYYEISSSIEEVETQRSEAVNTTEQAKEEHRKNERRFWMILFGLISLGVIGGGAFAWMRSDYYLDMDDLPVDVEDLSLDIDADSWDEFVESVEEKINGLLEGGEGEDDGSEARDLAWN